MRNLFYPFLLLISLILGQANSASAQKEANIWYFGSKAGLSFNAGAPVALTDGNLVTNEGCATISDKTTGQLLFYTDGTTVWNRQHGVMPNGTGLLGNSSSTQSAVAIPNPANSSQYYIFTVDAQAGLEPPSTTGFGGLAYSIVDMTLDGGLGDITSTKNVSLLTPTCEKLTAVRHCNGRDLWVMVHQWNTSTFYAYLVTPSGISAPVTTSIGIVHSDVGSTVKHESSGYLKFSPDAKKMALVCYYDLNTLQIFDFDNSTGIVSNPVTDNVFPASQPAGNGLYGCAFSPDNSRLYVSWFGYGTYTDYLEGMYDSYLYQYNMLAGSGANIISSKTLISSTAQFGYGAIQIGPDGKMYMSKTDRSNTTNGFSNYLDVINNPNALGTACNFVSSGLYLGGAANQSIFGLPDIVESFLIPQYNASLSYNSCAGNTSVTFTDTTLNGTITSLWNFGDPSSGTSDTSTLVNATHNYSSPGTYTATLYLTNACKTDSLKQTIVIGSVSVGITVNNGASCGQSNGSATANPTGGNGTYTYAWSNSGSSATVSNLSSGPCSVTVTSEGCSASATATIGSTGGLTISTSVTNTTCGGDNGTAKVMVVSGTATGYSWSNQAQTDSISGLSAGPYSVTVTGSGGCSATASVTVSASNNTSVTINSNKSIICSGDSAQICASPGYTTYTWNTNQTGQCIYAFDAGNYYLTATGTGGCTAQSNHVPLAVYPVPSVSIVVQGDTLSSFGAVTYQWYLNGGPITGATSQTYIARQSGDYSVLISDTNGCTALSSPVNITSVGIAELHNDIQFSIYPNPVSHGMMQIEISPQLIGHSYEIYDALGRLVIQNVLTRNKSDVDVSLLSAGIYLVKVEGVVRKMVKE